MRNAVEKTALACVSLAITGVLQPVFAYRPFATEDAGVAGKNVFQIEASVDYLQWENKDEDRVFSLVPIYGVTEKLELSLEIPFTRHNSRDNGAAEGLSDVTTVGKYQIYAEERDMYLALKTSVKWDNGDRNTGLGTGGRDVSLSLVSTKEFAEKATLHTQIGYTFVGKNGNEDLRDIHLNGIGVEYRLSPDISLAGEISVQSHPDRTSLSDPLSAFLGFLYRTNEKAVFDFGVRKGMTGSVPAISLTSGCSLSF